MHPPNPLAPRRRALAVIAAALSLAAAGTAYAVTSRTVTLNLEGGYGNSFISSTCEAAKNHYTDYHLLTSTGKHRVIAMSGTVLPVPSGAWTVKVKVKKCTFTSTGGWKFRTIWQRYTSGNNLGQFRKTYTLPSKGDFFAVAYYYYNSTHTGSFQSPKQNFRVTN